jgi:hypothetical protein
MKKRLSSENYPPWIWQTLSENTLPWHLARDYTIQEFSKKYTLHDAVWITLIQDVAYENTAILVIRWDPVWLPDEICQSTSWVKDWPILFVKVDKVDQISFLRYEDIGGIPRGISRDEVKEADGKQVWEIDDHYGGKVEIIFSGKTWFLGMDKNKEILKI